MSKDLIKAVSNKRIRKTLQLLVLGANPNYAEDKSAITPLHIAAQNNSLEIITALVFAGADTMAITDDGYTPLSVATLCNQTEAEELLKKLMVSSLQTKSIVYH